MEPVTAAAQPSALMTEQTEQALLMAAQTIAADVREQRNAADAVAAGQAPDALVPANAIVPIPNSAALAAVVDVARNLALDLKQKEAPDFSSPRPCLADANFSAEALV